MCVLRSVLYISALEIILENIVSMCTEKYQKALEFQEKVIETTNSHKNQLKKAMEDTSEVGLLKYF